MKLLYGRGDESKFITLQAISGTTPIVGKVVDMQDFDSVGLQLISTGTVAGSWKIEISNNYVPQQNSNSYGQVSATADTAEGTFTDVTALFLIAAAGTAIAAAAGSATSQYAQPRDFIRCRCLRVTFTPTSGAGNVACYGTAGSWN